MFQKPSRLGKGTGVQAEPATTTTAEEIATTTAEGTTTTTAEETTTTAAESTTTTTEADTTTSAVVESTTTTDAETTTTDQEQPSTATETSATTTAEVEATTTTQSDTETTTMDMATTTTSSTGIKETESTTSSIEVTESTPTTTATETIPRTEESTTTSVDVSSSVLTSIETQSPIIGSTTTSIIIPSVATTTTATTPKETESQTKSASSEEVVESTTSAGPLPSTTTSMEVSRVSTAPSSTVDQNASQSSVGARNLRTINQSCYAAESLTGDVLVPNDRCDLLCPGDPTLFCGGNVGETQRRRAISSRRLLTLYERQADVSISSGLSSATDEITSSGPAITSISLNPTVATETGISLSSEPVIIVPTSTEYRLPLTYPTIGTVHLTKGFNYTRTAAANTVTTVTYITVHPNTPGYLTTTVPANGENSVNLTVPTAACEAGGVKPGYPHEVSYPAHKITEVNSFAGPKPTMGEHSEPLPVHGSPKPSGQDSPKHNGQGKPQPSSANAPRPVSTVPDASGVFEPPRPLPTSAYQVPASKAWTTEQHAPGQIQKPEATQGSHPAAPGDGQSTSTPVVVASATRHHLMSWTVAGLVFSAAFLLA
ncbi:muc1-extracellular alpha- -glucan glucosidase [Fusarium avenaceum]|nr:muc1-extracellular alpha- -glucan glucosidase [Fusarium avenaceum]